MMPLCIQYLDKDWPLLLQSYMNIISIAVTYACNCILEYVYEGCGEQAVIYNIWIVSHNTQTTV